MSLFDLSQGASKLAQAFLNEKPSLMKKYVSLGLTAVGVALIPLDSVMKHLLAVQNLDPNTVPGAKALKQFQDAMDATFEKYHDKDFDDDYNFSWLHKKWEETNRQMKDVKLSKERFMELTDVSTLSTFVDKPGSPFTIDPALTEINLVAPESTKKEIPLEDKGQERENITEIGTDAIESLRNALKSMEKELNLKPTRKGIKVSKKSSNKTTGRGTKVKRDTETRMSFKEPATRFAPEVDIRSGVGPSKRTPARSLGDIASKKKADVKAKREATPEFQEEMRARLVRAKALTDKMIGHGLCSPEDAARKEQIEAMLSWNDESFSAMERVIDKYAPTKDAIAENKFKGSFRRIPQKRG